MREVLHEALVKHLAREEERLRREQPGPFMTPDELAGSLGIDRALIEGDAAGFLAIANTDPLPEGLPPDLYRALSEQRRAAGFDDFGRRIDPDEEEDLIR